MTGQIYNSWKVLRVDENSPPGKALYWVCECQECKGIYSVWGANIRSGKSKRCLRCGSGHSHAKQFGQVRTKRTAGETAHYYLFLELKKNARKRGITWNITLEQTKALVLGDCHYCGSAPSLEASPLKHMGLSQKNIEEAMIVRNGIDRVDSSKNYEPGNVVSCCRDCNLAKLDRSADAFLYWVAKVMAHQLKNL